MLQHRKNGQVAGRCDISSPEVQEPHPEVTDSGHLFLVPLVAALSGLIPAFVFLVQLGIGRPCQER
jgi:hypothetical protein